MTKAKRVRSIWSSRCIIVNKKTGAWSLGSYGVLSGRGRKFYASASNPDFLNAKLIEMSLIFNKDSISFNTIQNLDDFRILRQRCPGCDHFIDPYNRYGNIQAKFAFNHFLNNDDCTLNREYSDPSINRRVVEISEFAEVIRRWRFVK